VGLLPPRQWQLRSANVIQSKTQRKVWAQWKQLFESVKEHTSLTVVFNGDLVEGVHHASKQLTTLYMQEQEQIAIDAIDRALQYADWRISEDLLYFVDGTAVHADESEERIASDFDPVVFCENRRTHPALMLQTPQGGLWVAHKGPGVGEGLNEGNALRNKVKQIYVQCVKTGRKPPRFVVYSHRHIKCHVTVEIGDTVIDAWILPSFCAKSEFGYMVDPFGVTEVGGLVMDMDASAWKWRWDVKKI
jgi:hypothetical protein